jgi:hypothetical protein
MNTPLESLQTEQLANMLTQEHKKFLLALEYGSSGSDLQEIRDRIKRLESIIQSKPGRNSPSGTGRK